jgi:hypothetical protein
MEETETVIFKIGATIPVTQYGNLTPVYEVEAATIEEAQAIALPYLESLWARYCETGRELRTGGHKIKAFVGGDIDYDALTHTYSCKGETYLSGSQYAKQFEKPFDGQAIAAKMAAKFGVSPANILDMWKLKSEVSAGFGTAIHAAIELCERYRGLSTAMEKTTHLHDHPIIKKAVEGFYALQDANPAEVEIVIVDHQAKRAGRVDRLLVTGPKHCRVQDIKTNADITKSLPIYWKQLEFYGDIMKANGWEVEGLDIFHWNGQWQKHTNMATKDKLLAEFQEGFEPNYNPSWRDKLKQFNKTRSK